MIDRTDLHIIEELKKMVEPLLAILQTNLILPHPQ